MNPLFNFFPEDDTTAENKAISAMDTAEKTVETSPSVAKGQWLLAAERKPEKPGVYPIRYPNCGTEEMCSAWNGRTWGDVQFSPASARKYAGTESTIMKRLGAEWLYQDPM